MPKKQDAPKPKPVVKAKAVDRPLTEMELFYIQHHCGTQTEAELAEKVGRPACEITPAAKEFMLAAAKKKPKGGGVVYRPEIVELHDPDADKQRPAQRRGSTGSFEQFRTEGTGN